MQYGNNIGSIVEGALYHSMLTNDRDDLQNTLDVINTLPGIEDVNMYDKNENLVYSAFASDPTGHNNPDCKVCHSDLNTMFSAKEKTFKIISLDSKCEMSQKDYNYRLLLIKSPILNETSCYTSACHAHSANEEVLGSFVIRIPLEDLDHSIQKTSIEFYLMAGLTTLILATFLLFITRRKIKTPLNEIIKASDAVSKGDKSTRLEIKPNQLNDIRLVSLAFNEMLDNLQDAADELQEWSQQLEDKVQQKSEELSQIQNELIHIERIASIGRLSSSVAHEINNPLSGVLTYTKLVHKQLNGVKLEEGVKSPMLKYLKIIEEETKRCGDIVKSLLDFSRKDQQSFEDIHLHKILTDVQMLLDHQMKMENIVFSVDLSGQNDLINCNENQIKQACVAILLNATEAIQENGEIAMKTSSPSKDFVKLEISDNGVGIVPEDLPHIFEPFFSAKGKTNGVGLGLAIVHGIITNHHGKIEVVSESGKGTTVSMTLPTLNNPGS
jgi:two-component system NtrC family sensor kinase